MTEKKKSGIFYGYIVVAASFLIMVIMLGTQFSFGVFFKPLTTEFGWTRAQTSGAYSTFMVLHGVLFIVAGRLTDKYGARIVVAACGVFLGLGYFLMSQINSIWHLYLYYGVVISIGMAGGYVPLLTTVARWFVKRRGLMTGIVLAGTGVGTLVVPPVASWLITAYGWRLSYAIVGVVALVLTIAGAWFLRREPAEMGLLPYGSGEVKTKSPIAKASGLSIREAIQTRQFWIVATLGFCFNYFLQVIMVHIVPHATDLGMSAILAANVLGAIGGLNTFSRVMMGSVGDRIGSRAAIILSLIVMSVALFWLLLAKETWMLYLFAVVFGFGEGGYIAMQSPLVAELFGLKSHGALLGIMTFSMTVGGAIGPAVAGYMFDVKGSYQLAFLVSAGVSIIAIILSLLLRPVSDR